MKTLTALFIRSFAAVALSLAAVSASADTTAGLPLGYPGGYGTTQPATGHSGNRAIPAPSYIVPYPMYGRPPVHQHGEAHQRWHDRNDRRDRRHGHEPHEHNDGSDRNDRFDHRERFRAGPHDHDRRAWSGQRQDPPPYR